MSTSALKAAEQVVVFQIQPKDDYFLVAVRQKRKCSDGVVRELSAVFSVKPEEAEKLRVGQTLDGIIYQRDSITPVNELSKMFPVLSESGNLMVTHSGEPIYRKAILAIEGEFGETDFFLPSKESEISYEEYLSQIQIADPITF